jgi:hypothetical protein
MIPHFVNSFIALLKDTLARVVPWLFDRFGAVQAMTIEPSWYHFVAVGSVFWLPPRSGCSFQSFPVQSGTRVQI